MKNTTSEERRTERPRPWRNDEAPNSKGLPGQSRRCANDLRRSVRYERLDSRRIERERRTARKTILASYLVNRKAGGLEKRNMKTRFSH